MNGINTAKVMRNLDQLKSRPRPARLTARNIVETFRSQVECLINEHDWTVFEIMEAIATASEPEYSPYTLKNEWFKMLREEREQKQSREIGE